MEDIRVRKVYNVSTGRRLMCCWDTCERDGVTLYETRVREGVQNTIYVFCSERHKMLWVNSSRDLGKLPKGYRYIT